jgi:uncharacterized protein
MKNLFLVLAFCIITYTAIAQQSVDKAMQAKEMQLDLPVGKVSGTLLVPEGKGPFPVAIIIAGSGPTDRNGNQPMGSNNSLKMLAEELGKQGIATLRYDKRGIGQSKITQKESELRFDDFVNDARLWVEKLKSDKAFSKVYVIGHSEGSLIGMIAAAQAKADGFVSLAGVAQSADKILLEQLKALPPNLYEESVMVIDSLKAGKMVENTNPTLVMVFRSSVQPYMISWFKYEPVQEIKKLTIPVLIIQGSTDLQVKVEQATALAAANGLAKLKVIEQMNHVLKPAALEQSENLATYSNPGLALKEELAPEVIGFIKAGAARK